MPRQADEPGILLGRPKPLASTITFLQLPDSSSWIRSAPWNRTEIRRLFNLRLSHGSYDLWTRTIVGQWWLSRALSRDNLQIFGGWQPAKVGGPRESSNGLRIKKAGWNFHTSEWVRLWQVPINAALPLLANKLFSAILDWTPVIMRVTDKSNSGSRVGYLRIQEWNVEEVESSTRMPTGTFRAADW